MGSELLLSWGGASVADFLGGGGGGGGEKGKRQHGIEMLCHIQKCITVFAFYVGLWGRFYPVPPTSNNLDFRLRCRGGYLRFATASTIHLKK